MVGLRKPIDRNSTHCGLTSQVAATEARAGLRFARRTYNLVKNADEGPQNNRGAFLTIDRSVDLHRLFCPKAEQVSLAGADHKPAGGDGWRRQN
jgi:hypothetical protein